MTQESRVIDRESARSKIEKSAIENFESRPRDTGIRKTGKAIKDTHEPELTRQWFVIVPVKGTPAAKSRFGGDEEQRARLALAIALDTVEAVLAAPGVTGVLVVTSEAASEAFDETEAFVIVDPDDAGLAAAIALGLDTASDFEAAGRGTAILLGDLPALDPAELGAALDLAKDHDRAMVPDASGSGTTLITAADGQKHAAAFGPGSAAAHVAAGYIALSFPADSGLRSDVDTAEELAALAGRTGPRTAALTAG